MSIPNFPAPGRGTRFLVLASIVLVIGQASAQTAATAVSAPAAAIGVTDGESPGSRIEVTELKRGSGDTVTLRFTLINDSGEQVRVADLLGGVVSGYNVSGVHLIDPVGKKKYLVVTDSQKNCVCSANLSHALPAGQRLNLWAKFPAPPAEVGKVSLIFPHFIPMDDVPLG